MIQNSSHRIRWGIWGWTFHAFMLFVLCEDNSSEFWKNELIFSWLKIPTVFKSHWNWVFLSLQPSFKQTKANHWHCKWVSVPPEQKDKSRGSGTGCHHPAVTLAPGPPAKAMLCTHLPPAAFLSLLWKLTAVCQNPLAQSTPWSTRLGGKLRELPLWERGGTRTLLLVPAVLFWAQTELRWVPVVSLSPYQPEQPWVLWLAHISAWAGHHCTALTTICWKMEQGSQWPSAANLRKQLEKYYYCSC